MNKAGTNVRTGDRNRKDLPLAILALGLAFVLSESAADGPPPVIGEGVHEKVREGSSRVVVQVSIPGGFKPEGELPGPPAVKAQRGAIAHAQAAVLSRLAGARFRLVRQYTTVPFLVLEIGGEALALLEAMGDVVVGVRLDVTVPLNTGAAPGGNPGGAKK